MQTYEVEIRVSDAGATASRHCEYESHGADPATVAEEIRTELGKAAGAGRVHDVNDDG
jgi:hypothetical protein